MLLVLGIGQIRCASGVSEQMFAKWDCPMTIAEGEIEGEIAGE